MTKLLIGLLGAGVIATGGYAAATGLDDRAGPHGVAPRCDARRPHDDHDDGRRRRDDISGPCDEAEHRNDPRCTGASTPAPAPTTGVTTADDDGPGDISGPCDEAEHRNDPRCTGAALPTTTATTTTTAAAARRRRRRQRHGGDDDDRSGSNSGKG